MPIRIRIQRRSARLKLDARELVTKAGDAALEAIRDALLEGVSPVDGSPRPRNSEGRPQGVRSGHLVKGLHRGPVQGSESRASTTIKPPEDRADWVARQGDVVVAVGRVSEAIQDAADEFTKS